MHINFQRGIDEPSWKNKERPVLASLSLDDARITDYEIVKLPRNNYGNSVNCYLIIFFINDD